MFFLEAKAGIQTIKGTASMLVAGKKRGSAYNKQHVISVVVQCSVMDPLQTLKEHAARTV